MNRLMFTVDLHITSENRLLTSQHLLHKLQGQLLSCALRKQNKIIYVVVQKLCELKIRKN
jgi:hypothetical protein